MMRAVAVKNYDYFLTPSMTNKTDSVLRALTSRRSLGAKYLKEPAPAVTDYEKALSFAITAPDHGALHPARIVAINDRSRMAEFFAAGALAADATEEEAEKARSKALKAPGMLAVIVKITEGLAKVPAYEQWMTAGSFASNFLGALELMGFAGKIVSGASTRYEGSVKALCKEGEVIAAWIMTGTPSEEAPAAAPRMKPENLFEIF